MDSALFTWLPLDALQSMLAVPLGELWLALALLALTASSYASGIPGTLLPLSFTSGALLGGLLGAAAVATGAMVGAVVLYSLFERGSHCGIRRKYGKYLLRLDGLATAKGLAPIILMRLGGVPHLAVTALCALAGVGQRKYALATAVGVIPAIALSSIAGAAI